VLSCIFALSAGLGACTRTEKEPEGRDSATSLGGAAPAAAEAGQAAANAAPAATGAAPASGELAWTAPPTWQSVPTSSPMRKATFKIPKASGDPEDAETSVTQVGGGLEMNVARWEKQFAGNTKLTRTARKVGDLDVTIVEGQGTLTGSGMPGAPATPKEHQALLGAIVTSLEPPYFFKLTGPEKTVAAAKDDFLKFVGTLHRK
jgi:hypothetical protein